jgi:hypothetical protein
MGDMGSGGRAAAKGEREGRRTTDASSHYPPCAVSTKTIVAPAAAEPQLVTIYARAPMIH